jgi:flagellar export protein FliJ
MTSGRFRFERVLQVKRLRRKAAQDEVTVLRRDIADLEDGIRAAEAAQDESRTRSVEAAEAGRTAAELHMHAAYERGQAVVARAFRARVLALGELLEQRRAALMDRRREERQFEVLRERQQARAATAAARAEANFQDELALRKAACAGASR